MSAISSPILEALGNGPRTEATPWYTSSPYEPSLPPVTKLSEIDLLDPDLYHRGDPHAAWRLLRDQAPVFWHERGAIGTEGKGFWVVTRHADVEKLYRNSKLFSSESGPFLDLRVDDIPHRILPSMDGREHRLRKAIVSEFFTPKAVARLTESIRGTVTTLLDAVSEKGECDFSTEIAEKLPITATCDLLGISPDEAQHLAEMVLAIDGTDANALATYNQAVLSFFNEVTEQRRRTGAKETIVDVVANAEVDGERLSQEDVNHLMWLLFLGGIDSTAHAATGSLLSLFQHPEQLAILVNDPRLVSGSIEELLRWTATSHANKRQVMEDVEIAGTPIRKGDYVSMWSPAANRDERVYADPYRLNVRRTDGRPNTTFGAGGAHHCLGQNFAKLELRVLLEELFTRFPDVRPASPAIRGKAYTMLISPIISMPIRFTPAPTSAALAA